MATDAVLQVRISSKIKNEAEMVFEKLGLSLADAIRVFAIQAIEAQGFPFAVNLPKKESKVLHAAGIATKNADTSKIPLEKNAWQESTKEDFEI